MNHLQRIWLIPLLFLFALTGKTALAATDDEVWAPTPPRLSFIDGEVSYWREGAEDWARAQSNLALAAGDALYTGRDANFEVQFDSRSYVRADENSQLSLVLQEEHRIQFKLTSGRVSFDMRSMAVGDTVEVNTPNAVFVIEHPGYYRVEVNSRDTHFITRRGGEATVTTADGRSLNVYPSEDIVVSEGNPVSVATYAAPVTDEWDRWNDARSDRSSESISARYLPSGVYGAEELDHYGGWRVVPTYGSVWIPYGVSADWAPYSTGSWVWDPHYEWTWVDDAPWGWAPFHYGRWVYIDGFWAWAPGPVVRRPVYSPALVAFMIRDHGVSARISIGLPGLWWVALSWGEPVLPWWGAPYRRWHPYWGGWGGPRIVNNVVINRTTVIPAGDIRFHNATLPRAILSVPIDKFGRERVRATVEKRYHHTDFAPVRSELPVKPSRASLFGGAPRGVQPPQGIVSRPVVSTRIPRERTPPWQNEVPRVRTQAVPQSRYVVPPTRRVEDGRTPSRPPFGTEAGPERTPPPLPPRYGEVKRSATPPAPATPRSQGTERESDEVRSNRTEREQDAVRSQNATREQRSERREVRPAPPAGGAPSVSRQSEARSAQPSRPQRESAPQRGEVRQDKKQRALPGQPASQTYRGRGRENRDARP